MSSDLQIFEKINDYIVNEESFAFALVIDTWKSAPKPVGSILLISSEDEIFGSVSGGCVASAVIVEAKNSLNTKKTKILKFGVTNETAFQVGLACGGTIKILIEPITKSDKCKRELLRSFYVNYREDKFSILRIDLNSNKRELLENKEDLDCLLNYTKKSNYSFLDKNNFYYLLPPKNKMVIIGAVHIAQHLAILASQFDFKIYVIDPRSSFANKKRFPNATIIADWPDDAFKQIKINHETAIITLTHDPKIDDMALQIALRSDCFYIGSLGSQKTHEKRLNRLLELGFNREITNKIHSPIGLDIGSVKPNEIALSILAEIIKVKSSNTIN